MLTDKSAWLVDLGSSSGTRVNDQSIAYARLPAETHLHVGECEFQVHVAGLDDDCPLEVMPANRNGLVPVHRNGSSSQPAPSAASVASSPSGVPATLVRDVVHALGHSQEQALEKTRQLMLEMFALQQQSVTSRVESLERQNEQLLGALRTLLQQSPPRNGIPAPVSPPVAPPAQAAPPREPHPPTFEDVSESLERLDPDIHEAWVRGQLHTIADNLRKENDRGFAKLLRKMLPGDPDDALK